jgi:hypothetical protein
MKKTPLSSVETIFSAKAGNIEAMIDLATGRYVEPKLFVSISRYEANENGLIEVWRPDIKEVELLALVLRALVKRLRKLDLPTPRSAPSSHPDRRDAL